MKPRLQNRGWVGEFSAYHHKHRGEKIIVCGLGPSIEGFTPPEGIVTIGVNDCGPDCPTRKISFMPDYSLIVDKPAGFARVDGRIEAILKLTSTVFIPHFSEVMWRDKGLTFKRYPAHGQQDRARPFSEWVNSHTGLPQIHFRGVGSPFGALSLAGYMGAAKVGVIGVDKFDHPAFMKRLEKVDRSYKEMAEFLAERGCETVNLSPISALKSLRLEALESF